MQTCVIASGAHLSRNWQSAYYDVVVNLCDNGIRAKYDSLRRQLAENPGTIMIEERLEIIKQIAEARHIDLP